MTACTTCEAETADGQYLCTTDRVNLYRILSRVRDVLETAGGTLTNQAVAPVNTGGRQSTRTRMEERGRQVNNAFAPEQAECYPEATRGFANTQVEWMNKAAAITGLAYPISGDALANHDGHGIERAFTRRLRRAAAPAVEHVMDYIKREANQ